MASNGACQYDGCTRILADVHMLPCGSRACYEHIEQMVMKREGRNEHETTTTRLIKCVFCSFTHELPIGGLGLFRADPFIEHLIATRDTCHLFKPRFFDEQKQANEKLFALLAAQLEQLKSIDNRQFKREYVQRLAAQIDEAEQVNMAKLLDYYTALRQELGQHLESDVCDYVDLTFIERSIDKYKSELDVCGGGDGGAVWPGVNDKRTWSEIQMDCAHLNNHMAFLEREIKSKLVKDSSQLIEHIQSALGAIVIPSPGNHDDDNERHVQSLTSRLGPQLSLTSAPLASTPTSTPSKPSSDKEKLRQERRSIKSSSLVCQMRSKYNKRCKYCFKSFNSTLAFDVHMRLHTGEKPYQCYLCEMCFNQPDSLVGHMRSQHAHEATTSPITMLGHESTSSSVIFSDTACSPSLSTASTSAHAASASSSVHNNSSDSHKKLTRTDSSSSSSKNANISKKTFTCKYCSKICYSLSKLIVHTRVHTGEKPYQCQLCPMRFSQISNLNSHMMRKSHRHRASGIHFSYIDATTTRNGGANHSFTEDSMCEGV